MRSPNESVRGLAVDPVTGTWRFSLEGRRVEIEPRHGFLKSRGHLYQDDRLAGLTLDDLPTALRVVRALIGLPHPQAPTNPSEPSPVRPRAPSRTPAPKEAPRPAQQSPKMNAFSTKQAAEHVGLSPATLETLRSRGGGPPFVKLGRRVIYQRSDLDEWLAERRRQSTSDQRGSE